ncbi:MAG: glycosyltransferase family A protein [bacterium]|nr:glycosyltransferase family A protein [bacterium]
MCLFSIIIPTYNRAHLLKSTIKSVLSSDMLDFEIVVIDDGSIDETYNLIKTIDDPRLRYYYQENQERCAARNHGVRRASGKYIFFLDSDDSIPSDYLSYARKFIELNKAVQFFHLPFQKKKKYSIESQNFCGCQVYVKKEIALQYPFVENRDLKIGEDWFFILKINARHKLKLGSRIFKTYAVNQSSTMNNISSDEILRSLSIINTEIEGDQFLNTNKNMVRNVNYELLSLAAFQKAMEGYTKISLRLFLNSLLRKPEKIFSKRALAVQRQVLKSIFR